MLADEYYHDDRGEVLYLPPQDLDAEQATLGAILLGGPAVADVAPILEADDFYRDTHRVIFAACLRLYASAVDCDLVTVGAELRGSGDLDAIGGYAYLDRLVRSTPYATNAERYARIVRDKADLRAMQTAARELNLLAANPDGRSADEVFQSHEAGLEAVRGRLRTSVVHQWQGLDAVTEYEERMTALVNPIGTGFPKLDFLLNGGWWVPEVHVLKADAGTGKSSLVCHFIDYALREGRTVGLASLEMPLQHVVNRIVSARSGVPFRHLARGWGHFMTRECVDILDEVRRHVAEVTQRLIIDEARGYDEIEMARRLRSLRERGANLVVLDLINRVYAKAETELDSQIRVNRALQDLATPKELGCPVIVVAQNRLEKGASGGLAQLHGGKALVQDSPIVIDVRGKPREPGCDTEFIVRVEKNRYGETGDVRCLGDAAHYAWREAPAESGDHPWADRRDLQ